MWSQEITPKKKWSEDKTMNFVREYRSKDCLWDVNHKDYKNRRVRELVCCQMAEKFNCTPDDVRRKIKSLRGAYSHERNKIKDSLESNFDVDNVYVPSVIWYDEMDAVMNGGGSEMENTSSSIPETVEHTDNEHQSGDDDNDPSYRKEDCSSNNDNSDDEQASETSQLERPVKVNERTSKFIDRSNASQPLLHKVSSNSLSIVRKTKKKKSESHNIFAAIDKLHSISTGSIAQPVQENEFDLFGRSIAQQLKNFKDIKIALRLQHKIQGLISEERIREMTELTPDCVASHKTDQSNLGSETSNKKIIQIGLSEIIVPVDLDNEKFT